MGNSPCTPSGTLQGGLAMFRTFAVLACLLGWPLTAPSDARVGVPIPLTLPTTPNNLPSALPYLKLIHDVLDLATTRENPVVSRARLSFSEAQADWVVHRIKATVWVERTSTNYLGPIGVRLTIPCRVEFSIDMGALRYGPMWFDPARRRLIMDLPPITMREPVPILTEMKVETTYGGLRGVLLDAEKTRRMQEELLREDYQPAAREAAMQAYAFAQHRAREQIQMLLQRLFREAGSDIEVVVRLPRSSTRE
jgi:hypothetical protein